MNEGYKNFDTKESDGSAPSEEGEMSPKKEKELLNKIRKSMEEKDPDGLGKKINYGKPPKAE